MSDLIERDVLLATIDNAIDGFSTEGQAILGAVRQWGEAVESTITADDIVRLVELRKEAEKRAESWKEEARQLQDKVAELNQKVTDLEWDPGRHAEPEESYHHREVEAALYRLLEHQFQLISLLTTQVSLSSTPATIPPVLSTFPSYPYTASSQTGSDETLF